MGSQRLKRSTKLFERLLDSDVKAKLLTLFHNDPELSETAEGLASRVGADVDEVRRCTEDLVELRLLKKSEYYTFSPGRDMEIQDAISKQLDLGEQPAVPQGSLSEKDRISTGVGVIDGLLPDGLPASLTVLILSEPGCGDDNLLAHFAAKHTEKNQVVYVTFDNFPDNIRQLVDTIRHGESPQRSKLTFIDCYSKNVGLEGSEDHAVNPEDLPAVNIALSETTSRPGVSLVVVDSLDTVIRKRGVRTAIEFLNSLVARARQSGYLCLVNLNGKAFHSAVVAAVMDIVDGVIQLRVDESQQQLARSLRIFKMPVKHLSKWTGYEISDEGEFLAVQHKTDIDKPERI
jgi:KaiC/GvpD/RAD55 family RecA-like ATPase